MTLGNGVIEKPSFNDRFQPTALQVSSSAETLLTLGFSPCADGSPSCGGGTNGNLQSQTITIPGLSMTQTQWERAHCAAGWRCLPQLHLRRGEPAGDGGDQ